MKKILIIITLLCILILFGCANKSNESNELIKNIKNEYKEEFEFKNFPAEVGEINYVETGIGGQYGNTTKIAYKIEVVNLSKKSNLVVFSTDYGVSVKNEKVESEGLSYFIFKVTENKIQVVAEQDNEHVVNLIR